MKRTLLAATSVVLALGAIVTAAPGVAEPRCGFQGDWDCCGSAAIQRAVAEHLGRTA